MEKPNNIRSKSIQIALDIVMLFKIKLSFEAMFGNSKKSIQVL